MFRLMYLMPKASAQSVPAEKLWQFGTETWQRTSKLYPYFTKAGGDLFLHPKEQKANREGTCLARGTFVLLVPFVLSISSFLSSFLGGRISLLSQARCFPSIQRPSSLWGFWRLSLPCRLRWSGASPAKGSLWSLASLGHGR